MKYYQVGVSSEPKIIGVNNGVHQIEIEKKAMLLDDAFKDFLNFFQYSNSDFWKRQDEIQNFNIPTINAKLLKKAKLTDMMGYTENITFLDNVYSEKYINILKTFKIGNYSTFEIEISDVLQKYYMLFIETICLDEINYEKSEIFKGLHPKNEENNVHIQNFEEYKEFQNTFPIHAFKKISISKEYLGKDIIKIQGTTRSFYSEKLIDFLLDCGITGLAVRYENSIELDFY